MAGLLAVVKLKLKLGWKERVTKRGGLFISKKSGSLFGQPKSRRRAENEAERRAEEAERKVGASEADEGDESDEGGWDVDCEECGAEFETTDGDKWVCDGCVPNTDGLKQCKGGECGGRRLPLDQFDKWGDKGRYRTKCRQCLSKEKK
jgi:hypothetical protein